MPAKSFVAVAALFAATNLIGTAYAQQSVPFDQAVFYSCDEAQAMTPQARRALAEMLAERSAIYRGVAWPLPDQLGDDAGLLVRGICTMYPEANLFGVLDRVIRATYPR